MTSQFRAGFTAATFRARREQVLQRLEGGAMVLPSAPVRFRSHDSEYRYRPDSELYYVSGFEEPQAVIVLADHLDTDRFVAFVRPRDEEAERWSGVRIGVDRAGEWLGADAAYPIAELESRLPKLLHGAASVHYRLGREPRTERCVREALEWSLRRGPRKGLGPRSLIDPGQILNELRLRKDALELACIERAAAATVEGFEAVAQALEPGVGEWELEAIMENRFRAGGAAGPAFSTIVGAGVNGCVLHYVDNGSRVGPEDLVLVDAGAEMDLYAADITRTFPAAGTFTGPQRDLYEVVARALDAGVTATVAGAPFSDIHDAAVEVLTEGLLSLGLISGSLEDALEQDAHKAFFPHQTSHWLGLDVHEPGDYVVGGESRPLAPGMVLTVEPGLYVPTSLGDAGRHFQGFAIRLEDDVLVGTDGPRRLTGALPTDAGSVAALVQGGAPS